MLDDGPPRGTPLTPTGGARGTIFSRLILS